LTHQQVLKSRTGREQVTGPAHWHSRLLSIVGLFLLLGLVIVLATSVGSVKIPLSDTWRILIDRLPFVHLTANWSSGAQIIIWDIRLPRVLLAGTVGMALSVAGATYQGLFRNPMADPYLIGVAQGSALGAVIGFLLPVTGLGVTYGLIPALAFAGALVSVMVVYALARVGKTLPMSTLILAGVALGALLGAVVAYLTITSGQVMRSIMFWLSGSFALSQWSELQLVLPITLIGSCFILLFGRPLNIMQLDEEQAQQLGVNVERLKLVLLVVATLITAAAVSFVGIIGFVGIIIPHAVRLIWGPDYRFLLPLSMLCGAIFLILGDLLARTMLAPTEIPIGVITALAGAPFFLYLLRRKARMLF
jgi:iron complex transport system permease protein